MNRKFYDENTDSIITLEEVKSLYDEFHEDGETFADFLRNATDNNGSLEEVRFYKVTAITADGEKIEFTEYGSTPVDAMRRWTVAEGREEYSTVIHFEVVTD